MARCVTERYRIQQDPFACTASIFRIGSSRGIKFTGQDYADFRVVFDRFRFGPLDQAIHELYERSVKCAS